MGHADDKRRDKPQWEVIEVVTKDNAAVEVSMLDLQIPRFTFRVGTAHYPELEDDDDAPIRVGPRLTTFNAKDAADILAEVADKYEQIREERIEEVEERKRRARNRSKVEPDITMRRPKHDDNED